MPSRVRLYAPPSPSLYDEDFAARIEEQVRPLRAGQHANLDVPNLIEALEGLTKRDERALGSQLKRIMAHMLRQRCQPQRASRSRADSIENGREEIADLIEQSPSLRRTLPGLMAQELPARRVAGEPRYTVAARDLSEQATFLTRRDARGRRAHRNMTRALLSRRRGFELCARRCRRWRLHSGCV